MTGRTCAWCGGPISPRARADAKFCSTSHRQASHRTTVRRELLEATDRPLRLAYADPPYIGLAGLYRDHPDYAGEVDHAELVSRLQTYDGWALSCSSASVPAIAALLVAGGRPVRLAVWHRRRPPHPTARIVSGWEGLFYVPARRVVPGSRERFSDVLLGVDARPRPTLPGSVIGMKPPKMLRWVFGLLGAMPGDSLDDLYPGSGMVGRAWAGWTSAVATRDASGPGRGDASVPAGRDG